MLLFYRSESTKNHPFFDKLSVLKRSSSDSDLNKRLSATGLAEDDISRKNRNSTVCSPTSSDDVFSDLSSASESRRTFVVNSVKSEDLSNETGFFGAHDRQQQQQRHRNKRKSREPTLSAANSPNSNSNSLDSKRIKSEPQSPKSSNDSWDAATALWSASKERRSSSAANSTDGTAAAGHHHLLSSSATASLRNSIALHQRSLLDEQQQLHSRGMVISSKRFCCFCF